MGQIQKVKIGGHRQVHSSQEVLKKSWIVAEVDIHEVDHTEIFYGFQIESICVVGQNEVHFCLYTYQELLEDEDAEERVWCWPSQPSETEVCIYNDGEDQGRWLRAGAEDVSGCVPAQCKDWYAD